MASEMRELSPPGAELVAPDSCLFPSCGGDFHFGEARLVKIEMDGLRIYVMADLALPVQDPDAFYSRRDNGPFYYWTFCKSNWSAVRVTSSTFSTKELTATSWKVIPAALQRSIVEHYQD